MKEARSVEELRVLAQRAAMIPALVNIANKATSATVAARMAKEQGFEPLDCQSARWLWILKRNYGESEFLDFLFEHMVSGLWWQDIDKVRQFIAPLIEAAKHFHLLYENALAMVEGQWTISNQDACYVRIITLCLEHLEELEEKPRVHDFLLQNIESVAKAWGPSLSESLLGAHNIARAIRNNAVVSMHDSMNAWLFLKGFVHAVGLQHNIPEEELCCDTAIWKVVEVNVAPGLLPT